MDGEGLRIECEDGLVQSVKVLLPDGSDLTDSVELLKLEIIATANPTGQTLAVLTIRGVHLNFLPGQVTWQIPGTPN